jgi:hypothetical protein
VPPPNNIKIAEGYHIPCKAGFVEKMFMAAKPQPKRNINNDKYIYNFP